ncbi:hypothetical protein GF420_15190 [candidate division GN15 bacterium]|nr:hypothetical protein [candidate division GN15 bacterium]
MPAAESSDNHVVTATLRFMFETDHHPLLRDITSALYGLELLHDFAILATEDTHRGYVFDDSFWSRSKRPIASEQLIRVSALAFASPLTVDMSMTTSSGITMLLAITHFIDFWPLKREKLLLEIGKLRKIEPSPHPPDRQITERLASITEQGKASRIVRGIVQGLDTLPIRPIDVMIVDGNVMAG